MKLYLQSGTYYEKQADVPKGKFETVEFPFAASPKADFVSWLNSQRTALHPNQPIIEEGPVGLATPRADAGNCPRCHQSPASAALHMNIDNTETVVRWIERSAEPRQVEEVFAALGARFHQLTKG